MGKKITHRSVSISTVLSAREVFACYLIWLNDSDDGRRVRRAVSKREGELPELNDSHAATVSKFALFNFGISGIQAVVNFVFPPRTARHEPLSDDVVLMISDVRAVCSRRLDCDI